MAVLNFLKRKKKAATLSFCLNLTTNQKQSYLKTAAPRLVCGPQSGFWALGISCSPILKLGLFKSKYPHIWNIKTWHLHTGATQPSCTKHNTVALNITAAFPEWFSKRQDQFLSTTKTMFYWTNLCTVQKVFKMKHYCRFIAVWWLSFNLYSYRKCKVK